MNLRDTLTAKIGPAPVWVWGVGLGLGINGARWAWSRRPGAPKDTPAPEGDDTAATGGDESSLAGNLPAGEYAYGAPGTPSPNPAGWNPAPDLPTGAAPQGLPDNAAWIREATAGLSRARALDALTVAQALQKYTSGDSRGLTPGEQAIVSWAIADYGTPPEGAPPMVAAAPAQASSAPNPSAAPAVVTVPRASIKYGETSPAVGELQRELAALGLYSGPIDNRYGPLTRDAVLRLQQMLGMTGTRGVEYGPIAEQRLLAWKKSRQ